MLRTLHLGGSSSALLPEQTISVVTGADADSANASGSEPEADIECCRCNLWNHTDIQNLWNKKADSAKKQQETKRERKRTKERKGERTKKERETSTSE